MSVVGGVRFIRQGCLDPTDMLPMTEGRRGYDDQIAEMLRERGWQCAKLPRLRAMHLGRGLSTVEESTAYLR